MSYYTIFFVKKIESFIAHKNRRLLAQSLLTMTCNAARTRTAQYSKVRKCSNLFLFAYNLAHIFKTFSNRRLLNAWQLLKTPK
jgi:hypothetical protein